ncbi:MAG: hypothetical protein KDA89_14870, partial [Planctomycetaceae bacterium]|nr:hypothetical protein [Planctomycetaceae bacterium]
KSTVKGINTDVLRFLSAPRYGIAVQIYYNPGIRAEKASAEKLFRFLEIKGKQPELQPATDEEGADQSVGMQFEDARQLRPVPESPELTAEGMVTSSNTKFVEELNKYTTDFFHKYVRDREDPWKTRTSRLQ